MSQRKSWSIQEDQALKYLYEIKGIHRWSCIARKMSEEYNLLGRNGKQCRQRYHNHLNPGITKQEWKIEEEKMLIKLHNQFGNRWAMIGRKLPGRTDNCVKNHFYSKVRKAIRNVNKIINQYFKKEYKQLKVNLLYKIIQIAQEKYRNEFKNPTDIQQTCFQIKNQLLEYSFDQQLVKSIPIQELKKIGEMIKKFNELNKMTKLKIKKKKQKKQQLYDQQEEFYEQIMMSQSNLTERKITRRSKNKDLSQSNFTHQSQFNIHQVDQGSSHNYGIKEAKESVTEQMSNLPNLFEHHQLKLPEAQSLFLQSYDFMERNEESIFGFTFNQHNLFSQFNK